ncbi:MAG: alpha-2-macroglobulin family protein, partial [Thermoanaerobaculia bacterium]
MKLQGEDVMRVEVGARARRSSAILRVLFPLLVFSLPLMAQVGKAGTTTVVPDQFLRRWDPLTIFFASPTGPAAGGAEDAPSRYVQMQPEQPGAFTWLDVRTLQFRPAEPWPPLATVTVKVDGKSFRLATLMAAPTASEPRTGAEGLPPLETIGLTFPEPIAPEALARALSIEHRPLPGLAGDDARRLSRQDFEIKSVERAAPGDAASYVLRLRQAIPLGRKVFVRFALRLDEGAGTGAAGIATAAGSAAERAMSELVFSTAEPFRAVRFGCRRTQLPVVASGARYPSEQALACEESDPAIVVEFNAPVEQLAAADGSGVIAGRNFVRVTPAVANFAFTLAGKRLEARGDFARETAYRVTLAPAALRDLSGRTLDLTAPNELTLSFARPQPYLHWGAASGVVERGGPGQGPQMVPLTGRGDERLDLRLYRIAALDRSFWPFPDHPVEVDESQRPPGPGERPQPYTAVEPAISPAGLAQQIAALGSPEISVLVDLPLRRDGAGAAFGLDLAPHLARLSGAGAAGTYLVGLRRVDGGDAGGRRSWMRLQVTDLALTTLEEPRRTVFVVTSLATAQPLAGAAVTVEGSVRRGRTDVAWEALFRGTTDAAGRLVWEAPGTPQNGENVRREVRRIVVTRGDDSLALDPRQSPDSFANGSWTASGESWLQWTQEDLGWRGEQPRGLAHLFVERPVYRPAEPVHIKGFLRQRYQGRLEALSGPGFLVVEGPGDLVWRYPLTVADNGSFYWKFDEKDLPTGTYRVRFELTDSELQLTGTTSFRKEAYRLPQFEVRLDAPERAALDRPFDVDLTASYYAGGRVAARPVAWRVTQFPYEWTPKARTGFFYSSDGRFSRVARFESTPALERTDSTDESGHAKLALNPAVEATAQPRTYVVEATVVGADDQTVTSTRSIVALPPFVLGLEVPRYVERATGGGPLRPRFLVVGPDDKPISGQKVTVRLIHRQWHAHLRASDFSDGVARYITEVVDEKVLERQVVSAAEAQAIDLELPEAGVYVVELEAHDHLGRAQTVAVDLFAGGGEPVAWEKPPAAVFQVTPDKAKYEPGERARLVLQSPFQNGEALAVVEAPDGNRYSWLPVRGGQATFELPIAGDWAPRLPVHFLLMRGRLAGTRPVPGNATDLGRPSTFGATAWLDVEPKDNRLVVELEYPERARPGQEIEVAVRLKDPDGAPVAGEVTLWLVDQAVLALGREARLDPLPSFLAAVRSFFSARDTRSLIFGFLPFVERPGGDEGEEGKNLLDRQTIRKNFQAVPYYNPTIVVGPDGVARVKVKLSDDLTNFKLRAKAVSGVERFGFAVGHLEVRQPVVVQPALPRFVRPGDHFLAAATGRVVEGEVGPGKVSARFEGVELDGPATQSFDWVANRALRFDFPVTIPTPAYDGEGRLTRNDVLFHIGAERNSDGAGDAVEVRLPLRDDRDRVVATALATLVPGTPWKLPEAAEAARPGSLRRKLLASNEPGILELASGLDFLLRYPYGCTEQRLSTARAQLALRRFRDVLHLDGGEAALDRAVKDTLDWVPLVEQPSGLVAYWPGSAGSVALTSWVAEFLAEAREGGYTVDAELLARLTRALEQALRSDYSGFADGESWSERTWALRALARLGKFDAAYGNELARRAQFLDLENVANVVTA